MYCARLEKEIESRECPPIITATRDHGSLRVCRACPQGIALAGYAQVRPNYYRHQKELMQEQNMPEEKTKYRAEQAAAAPVIAKSDAVPAARKGIGMPELAKLADVPYASANRVHRGLDQTGRNKQKLDEALAVIGLTWADVHKVPHADRRQRNAAQKAAEAYKQEKANSEAVPAIEPQTSASAQEHAGVSEKFDADVSKSGAAMITPEQQLIRAVPEDRVMPLDRLLNELKRRLPAGAKVTIEF